jgi:hypothetical protein
MFLVGKTEVYEVWVSRINRPFSFSTPFGGGDFALMLVVACPSVTAEERGAVSSEIVRQGCRYAVCTGNDCSLWDDSIDLAFLATSPGFSPPDERFVMTTWHEDQPLEDVAHYFRWNTVFDDFVPQRFLALLLGGDAETEGQVRSAIEMWFG